MNVKGRIRGSMFIATAYVVRRCAAQAIFRDSYPGTFSAAIRSFAITVPPPPKGGPARTALRRGFQLAALLARVRGWVLVLALGGVGHDPHVNSGQALQEAYDERLGEALEAAAR